MGQNERKAFSGCISSAPTLAKELGQMGHKNRPSCLFHRQRSIPSILPRVRVMSISSTLCDVDSNGSNPMSITIMNFDRYLKFDLHDMEPLTNVPHIQSTPGNSLPLVLIWNVYKAKNNNILQKQENGRFRFFLHQVVIDRFPLSWVVFRDQTSKLRRFRQTNQTDIFG